MFYIIVFVFYSSDFGSYSIMLRNDFGDYKADYNLTAHGNDNVKALNVSLCTISNKTVSII